MSRPLAAFSHAVGGLAVWLGQAASPGTSPMAIAVALGLPAPPDGADDFDVLIKAFTFDGDLKQTRSLRARVDARASAVGADGQVQIVDRLDLPSGRYQLRAGVTSVRRQTSGSVYADLDVPDFSRDSLSLSGDGPYASSRRRRRDACRRSCR